MWSSVRTVLRAVDLFIIQRMKGYVVLIINVVFTAVGLFFLFYGMAIVRGEGVGVEFSACLLMTAAFWLASHLFYTTAEPVVYMYEETEETSKLRAVMTSVFDSAEVRRHMK